MHFVFFWNRYQTWRRRGWCRSITIDIHGDCNIVAIFVLFRVEFVAAYLAVHALRMVVCEGGEANPTSASPSEYLRLQIGHGQVRKHSSRGKTITSRLATTNYASPHVSQ